MSNRVENHFCGMLIIRKEQGYTSSDVVAKLRGILRMRRIGHTGTLDPMAEGVLPVCLGSATRLTELIAEHDKEYVCRMRLGVRTDTQDMTGTIRETLTEEEVRALLPRPLETIRGAAAQFTGEISQIPPMYSAVWVNGRRLYDLARKGITVERQPRTVTVHELEILGVELPYVIMRIVCSRGTYIRTICEDMGNLLGTGGAMDHLLRTRVERFTLDEALTLGQVQELGNAVVQHLIPVDALFADAPSVHIREEDLRYLQNGNPLSAANTTEGYLPRGDRIRVYDEKGEFYALYQYEEGRRRILPVRVFHETASLKGNAEKGTQTG